MVEASRSVRVTVAWSPRPRVVEEVAVVLAHGATVADAIAASGLEQRYPGLQAKGVGIWYRQVRPDRAVQDGDRVELYRPLVVEPMAARRARFEAQGARGAGLFARRRPGGKAGY